MNKQMRNARTILIGSAQSSCSFSPFPFTFPPFNHCLFFFLNEEFLRIVALGVTSDGVTTLTPSHGAAARYCTASPVPLSWHTQVPVSVTNAHRDRPALQQRSARSRRAQFVPEVTLS